MARLVLDPVTRIEGHLRIDAEVLNGRVSKAWSRGEMFRGFETILVGRDPLDAPTIVERICGVCPVSHGIAAVRALERALGIQPPPNGRLLRNLILAADTLQSHILHFYHLSALDFIRVEDLLAYKGDDPSLRDLRRWAENELASNRVLPAAPFLPKLAGDYPQNPAWSQIALGHYVEAFEIRKEAHKMAALFGGRMPHPASLVPGGVTCGVQPETVENYRSRMRKVREFVERKYLPDLAKVASLFPEYARIGRGTVNYLSFGAYEEEAGAWLPGGFSSEKGYRPLDTGKIREDVGASFYSSATGRAPLGGETVIAPHKKEAYSWLKAPRYDGQVCEVGPLARLRVAAAAGHGDTIQALKEMAQRGGVSPAEMGSVLGRHLARGAECRLLLRRMEQWLDRLDPRAPSATPYKPRLEGAGEGLVEAPRGALGHWIEIRKGRITRYQCVVPSTWNFSPRGDGGEPGPVEAALVGVPVRGEGKGLEVARVVRSFDPCIACAVH